MLWTYPAVIVRWKDGDTLVVHIDQGFHDWKHDQSLRLLGIDAPDAQPGKDAARAYCAARWPAGTRLVVRTKRDKKGNEETTFERWLADAWETDDTELPTVSDLIRDAGHAKPYWGGPR